MSTPARAKKLNQQMPMETATSQEGKTKAQQVARKIELAALRQEVKFAVAQGQGKAAKVMAALTNLHAKFGQEEFSRAVRENNLTYKGLDNISLVNVTQGKGPVQ